MLVEGVLTEKEWLIKLIVVRVEDFFLSFFINSLKSCLILRLIHFEYLKQEVCFCNVEASTLVERYGRTFSTEIIEELRVLDDRDRHIVTLQLNWSTENARKFLISVALKPYTRVERIALQLV